MASRTMINTAMISVLNRSQNTRVSSAASREGGVAVGINSILIASLGNSNHASVVLCHVRLFSASATQSFARFLGKPQDHTAAVEMIILTFTATAAVRIMAVIAMTIWG